MLGGTDFFGRETVKELFRLGHEVHIFTRGKVPAEDLPIASHIKGDRTLLGDLKQAATEAQPEILIDNLAYAKADVEKTLAAFPSISRYILTSTISVYRFRKNSLHTPWLEDSIEYDCSPPGEDPKNIHWEYARGKLEAEKCLISQGHIPWTIVRPTVVYGPNDSKARGFWYLSRLLDKKPLLLADGGTRSFRMVYSKDVATAFGLLITNPRAIGKAFNIAQSEIVTLKDFLLVSAQALGIAPQYVNLPYEALSEELAGPYGSMVNVIPSIDRATTDLGFHSTPFEQYVAETALWFRDHFLGDADALRSTRKQELEIAAVWAKTEKKKKTA